MNNGDAASDDQGDDNLENGDANEGDDDKADESDE